MKIGMMIMIRSKLSIQGPLRLEASALNTVPIGWSLFCIYSNIKQCLIQMELVNRAATNYCFLINGS